MIMRTIDPVVAYCMQNNMYYFTRVAIVIDSKRTSNVVLEHTCGFLCVYREILDSVRNGFRARSVLVYKTL